MQYTTRFFADNSVIGSKFRLNAQEALRIRNVAGTADLEAFKTNASDQLEFQMLPRLAGALPLPNALKELVSVEWVQNYIIGKTQAKNAVNVLSDSNRALSGTGTLTIDSITVTNGMRVGLIGQTDGIENGIYVATVGGGNWSFARATDFDQVQDPSAQEVTSGAYFKVISGTVYQGWEVQLTTADPIVIGTTALTFVSYPTSTALTGGDMIKKTGNDFSIDLATLSGLVSTNPGNPSGQLKVLVDTAPLEKDQSVKINTSTGAVVAKVSRTQSFTLAAQDIINGYLDLDAVAGTNSVKLFVVGGGFQRAGDDFSVNYTGGTGGKTRVTLLSPLATGGVSALVAGDVVDIDFMAFA